MSIIDVECKTHGTQEMLTYTPENPVCPKCQRPAKRKWSASHIKITTDFTAGWDMGAGKVFSTKRERDNWLAEKGSRKLWRSPRGTKVVMTI